MTVASDYDLFLKNCKDYSDIIVASNNPLFPVYLVQANPAILSFITKNFNQIFEFLFEEDHKTVREIRNLLAILETRNFKIKTVLVQTTKFVEYVLNYPEKNKKYYFKSSPIFFNSLPFFILDDNEVLLSYFAKSEFLTSIIENCNIQEAFMFVRNALTMRISSFGYFFKKENLPKILIRYVNGDSLLNINAIKLFQISVDIFPSQCVDAVIESNTITLVIDTALQHKCSQLIDFINFLYAKSFKFKMESQWFEIEYLIDDRIPEVCDYLLNTKVFDAMSRSGSSILLTYLRERHQQFSKVTEVAKKYARELFENPTNSFLHITAYKFLESLKQYPNCFNEVVVSTRLCEKILEAYKGRESNKVSCYWGVLRKISEMIDEPTNVSVKEWQSIVVASNEWKEKIISTPTITTPASNSPAKCRVGVRKSLFSINSINMNNLVTILIFAFAFVLFLINNNK